MQAGRGRTLNINRDSDAQPIPILMTLLSAMMLCKKAHKFVAQNLRISASNSNLNVIA